jgi:uncharacterized protein YcnI
MKNAIFIFLLAFAGTLNAQTASADAVTPIESNVGTRMQVTLVFPDGSRRMDFIKITENEHYFYLALPSGRVRYSKANDVATQYDGSITTKLLSNYWVKVQLILDANQLVAVDGSLRDVVDGKSVKIYDFSFGE